jgi:hypothetical protein
MNLDNFELDTGINIRELVAIKYLLKVRPDRYSLKGRTYKSEDGTFMVFRSKEKGDKLYMTFYMKFKDFKWKRKEND